MVVRVSISQFICWFGVWLISTGAASVANAQSATPASAPAKSKSLQYTVDGSFGDLFVGVSDKDGARVFHRTRFDNFDTGVAIPGILRTIAAAEGSAFLLFADKSIYELNGSDWTRVSDAPGGQPRTVAADERSLYVVVAAQDAAGLKFVSDDDKSDGESIADDDKTFTPSGPENLALLVYKGRTWRVIAEVPQIKLAEDAAIRLLVRDDVIYLCAVDQQGQILGLRWDAPTADAAGAWTTLFTMGVGRMTDFWLANINDLITIIVARGVGAELQIFRLLPDDVYVSGVSPVKVTFVLAPEPRDGLGKLNNAFGFNDHLALLYNEAADGPTLRFARVGEPPIEETVALPKLVRKVQARRQQSGVIRFAMFLLLLAVFTGLFVFRRQTLQSPPTLPAHYAPAFASRRLLSGLIDIVPFAWVWANTVHVDLRTSLGELASWAGSVELPSQKTLLWWGATIASYTVYTLAMELLVRRTVGKSLTKIKLVGDNGEKAAAWQVLVRNLLHLIELAPPFWVLGFLVVLTPRRQRVGDIFARTAVVQEIQYTVVGGEESASQRDDQERDDD